MKSIEVEFIDLEYLSSIIASDGNYKYLNSKIDELLWKLKRLAGVDEDTINKLDELVSEQELVITIICYKQGLIDCFRLRVG